MTLYDLGKVVGDDGEKGDTGNGIQSITKTGTSGLVDTYTITFTDGTTTTFTVTNGSSASVDIVTSWNSTTSDSKVPSEKLAKTSLDGKAPTSHANSATTYGVGSDSNYGHNKVIQNLTTTSTSNGLSLHANQGKALKDLIDAKPSASDIPTKTSDLTNDGDGTNAFLTQHQSLTNYVQKSNTSGLLKNDGTVMTSGTGSSNYSAGNHTHSGYVSATKVTSWSSTVSDSNVPSEKLTKDTIDNLIGIAIQYIQQ